MAINISGLSYSRLSKINFTPYGFHESKLCYSKSVDLLPFLCFYFSTLFPTLQFLLKDIFESITMSLLPSFKAFLSNLIPTAKLDT